MAAQGRDDLLSRGLNPEGRKTLRLFSTWEITRYLIPVADAAFPPGAQGQSGPAPGPHRDRRRRQMVHPR